LNKKLALAILLVLVSPIVAPVLADPTSGTIDWEGSGELDIELLFEDDAITEVETAGSEIWGLLTFEDENDNPYGYDVDTCWAELTAGFDKGGYIEFLTERTDSHEDYGPPGQVMYTFIQGDWGAIAKTHRTNLSHLESPHLNYPITTNGHRIEHRMEVGGSFFEFFTVVDAGEDQFAWLDVSGYDGSTWLNSMYSNAHGTSFNFLDADLHIHASEWKFEREARGNNYLNILGYWYYLQGPAHYYELIEGSGQIVLSDVRIQGG